jgi:hypothetical protein
VVEYLRWGIFTFCVSQYEREQHGLSLFVEGNTMDEKSKNIILLFFNSLQKCMEDLDDVYENHHPRFSRGDERGYFIAVEKMNYYIQEFIDDEIRQKKQ